jgi:hypothetical protein
MTGNMPQQPRYISIKFNTTAHSEETVGCIKEYADAIGAKVTDVQPSQEDTSVITVESENNNFNSLLYYIRFLETLSDVKEVPQP